MQTVSKTPSIAAPGNDTADLGRERCARDEPLSPAVLRSERELHYAGRFDRPGCHVDAMGDRDLEALAADDGDIRLAVKHDLLTAQCFDHEDRVCQVDSSTVLGVSGL